MITEQFLHEYIENSNKFLPTLPNPFVSVNTFYDVYFEEVMNWSINFFAEARDRNENYGGFNVYNPNDDTPLNPDYSFEYNVYFSNDLFGDTIPENAELAEYVIPDMDWYNPDNRNLPLSAIRYQPEDSRVYKIPYDNEVDVCDFDLETSQGARIANSNVKFARAYIYDIGRVLGDAVDFPTINTYQKFTNNDNPPNTPVFYVPKFSPNSRDIPTDLEIQAMRPYLGFCTSLYDDPMDLTTQRFAVLNIFSVINNKGINRHSYHQIGTVLDMDGKKFLYDKVFYDGFNHLIFVGAPPEDEEDQDATPGVLVTQINLLPLIKLAPIDIDFVKITEYTFGLSGIEILLPDLMTVKKADLPDADIEVPNPSTYPTTETFDEPRFSYNSELDIIEDLQNYLIISRTADVIINCTTGERLSVGGFMGKINDGPVYGYFDQFYTPPILIDGDFNLYAFSYRTGVDAPSCDDAEGHVYGYDFSLIGPVGIPNTEEQDEEEKQEARTEAIASTLAAGGSDEEAETAGEAAFEAKAEEIEQQKQDDNPFVPLDKEDMNPYEMFVLGVASVLMPYSTIHPDPRRLNLWRYAPTEPYHCYGTQTLIYEVCFANTEYERRIATNINPNLKELVIIGNPYKTKEEYENAVAQFNAVTNFEETGEVTTVIVEDEEVEVNDNTKENIKAGYTAEPDLLLMFNGIEPLEWSIKHTGLIKDFATLSDDTEEPATEGEEPVVIPHTKRMTVVNFHDPFYIKVKDSYRTERCHLDKNKHYDDLPQRERTLRCKVWPRTLPVMQPLETFFLDAAKDITIDSRTKSINQYYLFGPYPGFYVSGLRSELQVGVIGSDFLDVFGNGYQNQPQEAYVNAIGLPPGVEDNADIHDRFDESVWYVTPINNMSEFEDGTEFNTLTTFDGTTNDWILYMYGKRYGKAFLTLRDYDEHHQEDYSPPLQITQRNNLQDIEVFLWTVDKIPTTVRLKRDETTGAFIPQTFSLQIKGITSFPRVWLSSAGNATVVEDPSQEGSTTEVDQTEEEQAESEEEQMDNGPTATLVIYRPGDFRLVVMDSARIPFVSPIIKVEEEPPESSDEIVNV